MAQAEASYRRDIVRMLESILFELTNKTTTVTYAKRHDVPGDSNLFCGAARFGTTPQMFTLNAATNAFVRGASKVQWSGAGHEDAGAETLVDLR